VAAAGSLGAGRTPLRPGSSQSRWHAGWALQLGGVLPVGERGTGLPRCRGVTGWALGFGRSGRLTLVPEV